MTSWVGLVGAIALITGARTGIGRAIASALARCGAAALVLCGRDAHALAGVAAEVGEHGARTRTVTLDVSDLDAVRDTADRLAADQRIDVILNNAGIIRRGPLTEANPAAWHAVPAANLDAVFLPTRPLASAMITRKSGKIVNIASLLASQGGINVAAYGASKHAIVGLTQAMSNEWSPHGVNVNAVAPGYTVTDNTAQPRANPARYAEISGHILAGRWAQPGDIAGAVVFLCSPAASYVHGHTLVVDGGWMAR